MIELSKKAKDDLKEVLIKEVGLEVTNSFTDAELNRLGVFFLTIIKNNLKMKVREENENKKESNNFFSNY